MHRLRKFIPFSLHPLRPLPHRGQHRGSIGASGEHRGRSIVLYSHGENCFNLGHLKITRSPQDQDFIREEDLSPDTAGIRPKLSREGEPSRDFVIRHEADRGLPGLINLVGIESPGLTAALAIGALVGRMVREAW